MKPPRIAPSTSPLAAALALALSLALAPVDASAQGRPNRPVLHGQEWVAITGMPRGAEAGAKIFRQGGNAVDAACAMLAATATMWDVLSWGGETQALIYNPGTGEVVGINGLGVAPSGATPEFFREKDMRYPPAYGPLAAVTPGTPGALMTMLAEYGTLGLAEVLAPAIELAEGYPIPADVADDIREEKERIEEWRYSRQVFLPNRDSAGRDAPYPGQIFRQEDLAGTLRKLVEAERRALENGASRSEAIYAAYDRFYEGDIAAEIARSTREQGGLITEEDLAGWEVKIEDPPSVDYRGYEVYKLTSWVQGPVMLQALQMLEEYELRSMGYNSARYVHTLYQVMNHAFADRDFYYGDPYTPPDEPVQGLLSKEYAKSRLEGIDPEQNERCVGPGNPYRFQEGSNPFTGYLEQWPLHCGPPGDGARPDAAGGPAPSPSARADRLEELFTRGTTSIQAADSTGWVVSITPSGGWIPAVIAGNTGVGLSQRMQSFVVDSVENPYNVVAPGKRPRATLTPTIVLEEGRPSHSFSIQGGDFQDQNSVQFFLDMVEFGMGVQEAAEAANFNTYQLHNSFGQHEMGAGEIRLNAAVPPWVSETLTEMGYEVVDRDERTSGPMTAIWFDREHGAFRGAASDYGSDYGIAW